MTSIVVTGAGMLGEAYVRHLMKNYSCHDINVVDISKERLKLLSLITEGRVSCFQVDILDTEHLSRIFKQQRPAIVVHGAALTGDASDRHPDAAWEVNVTGTRNVIQVSKMFGASRFVFLSSFSVYGHNGCDIAAEDGPTKPTSIYGRTKLAAESIAFTYVEDCFKVIVLRLAGVYGGRPGLGTTRSARMIDQLCRRLLSGETLRFRRGVDRLDELIHCEDVSRAIDIAMHENHLTSQIINIGTGWHVRAHDLISLLRNMRPDMKYALVNGVIDSVAEEEINIPPLSLHRAKSALHFTARVTLNDGINRSVSLWMHHAGVSHA